MKVLIINELAKSGGAEMQTMRECALLQQFGNDARVITLDPNFPSGWIISIGQTLSRLSPRATPCKQLSLHTAFHGISLYC